MPQISLTDHELEMTMAALAAVTKTGGGGALHSLFMKIAEQTGFNEEETDHLTRTIEYQRTAASELFHGETLNN